MRQTTLRLAAAAAAVACSCACTPDSQKQPAGKSRVAASSTLATPEPKVQSAAPPQALSAEEAWPAAPRFSFSQGMPLAGHRTAVLDAPSGGQVLLSARRGEAEDSTSFGLLLFDLRTRESTPLRRAPTPQTQTGFADMNERYIVWEEAADAAREFSDWTVLAHDRTTGRTRVIAKHQTGPDGKPLLQPPLVPRLEGSRVAWNAVSRRDGKDHLDSYMLDLASDQAPRRVADDATDPHLAYPYLFARRKTADESQTVDIVRYDLRSGAQKTLATGVFGSLTAAPGVVAYADTLGGRVIVQNTEGKVLYSHHAPGGNPVFLVANGTTVAWVQGDASYAWDLPAQRLVRLGARPQANTVKASPGGLVWSEPAPDSEDALYVGLESAPR